MKTFLYPSLVALSAALFVTGCATKPTACACGKMKVRIDTSDVNVVKTRLVTLMTNVDFRPQDSTADHLGFSRPVNGTSGLFDHLAVESANASEAAYEFELEPKKSHVEVIVTATLSTRNGDGPMSRENATKKWAADIEHLLLNLKADVEGPTEAADIQKTYDKNKGRIGVAYDGAGYIIQVNPGGPADKAGLKTGDRIVRVNHWAFSDEIDDKVEQITGKPGTSVTITVLRDGKKMAFKMTRE